MTRPSLKQAAARLLAIAVSSAVAVPAWACAVCSGDPDSSLTQGAKWGVLVLLGCIGTVLAGIVSVSGYWIVRARRLARDEPSQT